MKYSDGQPVVLGDVVRIGANGPRGAVVCSIDDVAYTDAFPEAEWSYLERGVMVEFETMGLVHYEGGVEPDLKLVSRARP